MIVAEDIHRLCVVGDGGKVTCSYSRVDHSDDDDDDDDNDSN